MEDPLFEPWGAPEADAPRPSSAGAARWRSPNARSKDNVPRPPSSDRLTGTPGFLRTMAVPRLAEVAQRLQMARHTASVEDLLDGTPPTLRLTFRPWRGPWSVKLAPTEGCLELVLADGPESQVVVRTWLDPEAAEPTQEVRVAPSQLGAAWLEHSVLEFVKARLQRL